MPPEVKRTVSHGYEKQGFELADGEGMCALLGIDSYADRGALRFSAIAEGGAGALTKIVNTGTYLVSVTLGEEYGVWKNTGIATLTITGGAARTTQIMLIMLSVAGLAAVVLAVAHGIQKTQGDLFGRSDRQVYRLGRKNAAEKIRKDGSTPERRSGVFFCLMEKNSENIRKVGLDFLAFV